MECGLALGMMAAETRGSRAARQAAGTLPWIAVDDPAEGQRLQADHAARMQESANFQLGGPEKLTGFHDPQHALQQSGGLADLWYMDDGDTCVSPNPGVAFSAGFQVANASVGAEQNPLKTEVIHHVNDLDAAAPEWRIGDVRKNEPNLHSYRWKHHPRSRCRISAVRHGPAPEQGRRHPSDARARPALPGSADGVRPPSRGSGSQPCQPHPAGSRPHNLAGTKGCSGLRRDRAAVSRTALPGSHRGQHDTSNPQCRPDRNWVQKSARHRSSRTPGSSHRSQTAHPGMIRDAVWAGLLPEQILEAREVIETATST